ncbi:amidohydrolase family protein [Kordiimonas pumila]|uniref:Amidohydrolase family protein n=1 Tax=Kordiimonas pumila TaxID=2161677 RepID=A0ABV7D2Y7_9PROT|nr:amidohydrolase family protein [Kordiimonas pumila]
MIKNTVLIIAIFLSFLSGGVQASETPGVTVIHAGMVLDTPGEKPTKKQTIIVRDGVIESVWEGYVSHTSIDENAKFIDLSNSFVMPGLMDMHVHLSMNLTLPKYQRVLPPAESLMGAIRGARHLLLSGFTTVRGAGDPAEVIFPLRDAINRGEFPGPRIFASGPIISREGGHGYGGCDGVESCRKTTRKRISDGADWIKIATSGSASDETGSADSASDMFYDEVRSVVETGQKLKTDVLVHATSTEGINIALQAGARSIDHSSYADKTSFALFRKKGAYMVPTTYVVDFLENNPTIREGLGDEQYERLSSVMRDIRKLPGLAWKAGVKLAIGTDAGHELSARHYREFVLYVESGVPAGEAIKAGTVNAAELLRQENSLGYLRPGYIADIIAIDGNPLEDITQLKHVSFVMKDGKVFKLNGEEVLTEAGF